MSKAALSVYMYGLYQITGICLPFLFFPAFALGLFGLSAGDDMWVRMAGVLAGVSGFYYVMAVNAGFERFYAWTVPARFATALFLAAMVVLGKAGVPMLLFAGVDAIAGGLTWAALAAERKGATQAA
jgi:hypothetical protein